MNTRALLLATALACGCAALVLAADNIRRALRARSARTRRPPARQEQQLRTAIVEQMPPEVAHYNSAVIEAERIIAAAVERLTADERRRLDHRS